VKRLVKLLLKCISCNNYTFNSINSDESENKKVCPICNGILKTPHPAKFSMDNKYNRYLRELKREFNQS
jgi:rRNA maturation protein Nop10